MPQILRDLNTRRFCVHFLLTFFACLGALSGAIQALIVFFPDLSKLAGGRAFLGFIGLGIAFGLARAWPRPIREEYAKPKTAISISEGDILDERGHLVVGVCSTFDTDTPNIISRSSLQGQAQDRLFNSDLEEINRLIDAALAQLTPIAQIAKPGKTAVYEIGTVLPIRHGARWVYLSAYTDMDVHNVARATVDGVWKSLMCLWDEVKRTANGAAVAVPVIGGGQARLSGIVPAQDAIRLIVLSFMFASRKEKVCDELRILVHPTDFKHLDRLELQSFLSSLKPS